VIAGDRCVDCKSRLYTYNELQMCNPLLGQCDFSKLVFYKVE